MINYNPYDLISLLVNGKPISGRPYEFDSHVADQKTMKNAFGFYVKPTKVSSMCPDCGQGLTISVVLGEPPFEPFVYMCPYCRPAPPALLDPFCNPVSSGRIHLSELDPLLHNPNKVLQIGDGLVSDRFIIPEDETVVNSSSDFDMVSGLEPIVDGVSNIIEQADGISEEIDDFDDFDDSEMLDD